MFASANMEHPLALAKANKAGPVALFARNRLCALTRPGLTVDSANLLDRMLDDKIKLGTSTPRADPSGDYAWEVFRKADKLKPGAFATLEKKALQLVGGPSAPTAPPGRTVYGMLVSEGKADIFLTYCTNAIETKKENDGFGVVALPDALAVGADYGLTVMDGASPAGAVTLIALRHRMNVMSLPDEEARALGIATVPLRVAIIAAATLVTSASVAAAGIIGWVGLVVPHLARSLVGPDFARLVPTAAILGGGYLLLIDTLARTLAQVEIPLGILTAVIGTPFFIWLLTSVQKTWS